MIFKDQDAFRKVIDATLELFASALKDADAKVKS